jgi:hypothetical protein
MVDPSQVSQRLEDGMCPCRGCTVARKRVMKDVISIIDSTDNKEEIQERLSKYKEQYKI